MVKLKNILSKEFKILLSLFIRYRWKLNLYLHEIFSNHLKNL